MLKNYTINVLFRADPDTASTLLTFRVYARNQNTAWLMGVSKAYQLLSGSDGVISTITVALTPEPEPDEDPET